MGRVEPAGPATNVPTMRHEDWRPSSDPVFTQHCFFFLFVFHYYHYFFYFFFAANIFDIENNWRNVIQMTLLRVIMQLFVACMLFRINVCDFSFNDSETKCERFVAFCCCFFFHTYKYFFLLRFRCINGLCLCLCIVYIYLEILVEANTAMRCISYCIGLSESHNKNAFVVTSQFILRTLPM